MARITSFFGGNTIVALAILCAGVAVMEGLQLRKFRAGLKRTYAAATQPVAGIYVPHVELRDIASGTMISVGEEGSPVVLFVFDTTCPYCRQSVAPWKQAADSLAIQGIRAVGVSLDSLPETLTYARTHGLNYPVASFQSVRDRRLYRANTIPYTIVISRDAQIAYSRPGLVTTAGLDSILAAVKDTAVLPRVSHQPTAQSKEAT